MSKLTVAQTKTIEEYWMNIDDYKSLLKFREWELTENKTTDENIGGGRSGKISDPTYQRAALLLEDAKYQNFKKIIDALEYIHKNCDEDIKKIIELRYWSKNDIYEWDDIANELRISRSTVLRKRNLLVDKTAERLGWL